MSFQNSNLGPGGPGAGAAGDGGDVHRQGRGGGEAQGAGSQE